MSASYYLAGSSYYMEDVLGLDLFERAQRGILTHLLLNQPPVCDSHCRRCFMPSSRRGKVNGSLTTEESYRVIQEAADAGMLSLEISGEGEPLMSQQLPEIIHCANDHGFITTLITNGHSLTKEFIGFLFEHNVTLVISLFSLNAQKYEMDNNLCGSFNNTIENLKTAADIFRGAKQTVANKKIYRLGIHTTVQADNFDDLPLMRHFCNELDIFFSVAPLAPVGGGAAMEQFFISDSNTMRVNSQGHNSIILSRTSMREIGREVCGTCLYGLNVGYDGNILFDAHAGYEIAGLLGSVRTDTISVLIERQRKYAPFMFSKIDGFCPIRDPKWPFFLRYFLDNYNHLEKETCRY